MKLGIVTMPYVWKYDLESMLERFSEMGFKYIELGPIPFNNVWPRALDEKKKKELKELFKSFELIPYSLSPGFAELNLTSMNLGFREEALRQLKENIKFASDLGAQLMIVIPGKRYSFYTMPFDIAWKYSKAGINELGRYAEDYGVLLVLEVAAFNFIDNSKDLRRMVEEVNMENVRAMADTGNSFELEEDPADAITTLGDTLAHLHLCDTLGKTPQKIPIGMGIINFESVAAALKRIDYKGLSILEMWYPEEDLDRQILASKEKLEKLGWGAHATASF